MRVTSKKGVAYVTTAVVARSMYDVVRIIARSAPQLTVYGSRYGWRQRHLGWCRIVYPGVARWLSEEHDPADIAAVADQLENVMAEGEPQKAKALLRLLIQELRVDGRAQESSRHTGS